MKLYRFILLILLVLFLGCNKCSDETQKLKNILSYYKEFMSENRHLYIVRSQLYCDGCIQSIFLQLENISKKSKPYNITIISSDNKHVSPSLLAKCNYICDTFKLINIEFSIFANVIILETNNGKVVNCKFLEDSRKINLPRFVYGFLDNI